MITHGILLSLIDIALKYRFSPLIESQEQNTGHWDKPREVRKGKTNSQINESKQPVVFDGMLHFIRKRDWKSVQVRVFLPLKGSQMAGHLMTDFS